VLVHGSRPPPVPPPRWHCPTFDAFVADTRVPLYGHDRAACANSRTTLPQTHARPSALQRRQASAVLTQCRWTKRSWRSCKPRCGRWRHARPAARARQPRCAAPCPVHRLPPSAPRAHSAAARAGGGAPGPMRSLRAGALPFAVRHLTVRAHAAPRAALAPATCASPRCRCEREARVPCAGRRRPSTRRPAPTTSGCRCLRYAWRAVHALCAPALAPGHSHSRARALHARSVPDGAEDALSAHRERLRAATGIRLQHELRHADVRGARLPGRPPRLAAAAHAPFSPSFSRSPRPRCLAHQPDMDGGWSSSRATGILWVGARRLRPPVHNMLGRNLPAHAAAMQPQSRRADDEGGVSWCGLLRVTAHVSAGTRCLALAVLQPLSCAGPVCPHLQWRRVRSVHMLRSARQQTQNTLKRLGVNHIPGIEEVNFFRDDGSVIHFKNPKSVQASIGANTYVIRSLPLAIHVPLCVAAAQGICCASRFGSV
jgi:hypothetical protein